MQPETSRIPRLWERVATERWIDRLRTAGAIGPTLAVYSGYESDATGRYRLLVGCELPPEASAPDGAGVVEIPAGRYLVFSFKGALPEIVMEGWRQVWRFFEQSRAVERAYTADVEIYDEAGSGVDIWIAVK